MTEQENNDRTKLLLKDESRSRYVLWAAGGVLAALVAGAWYWYQGTQNTNAVKYVTEAVERGDVHVSVSADGTLAPVRTVSLGSELSGIVREVNIDVNDEIKEGQSLIVLDKRNLEAKVLQNRASLRSAEASRRQSAASLGEAELKLKRMQELNRLSKGRHQVSHRRRGARPFGRARLCGGGKPAGGRAADARHRSESA